MKNCQQGLILLKNSDARYNPHHLLYMNQTSITSNGKKRIEAL
jgi:hypothetical protein